MKRLLPLLPLIALLSGCGLSEPEARAITNAHLRTTGDVVGTLPDGRQVARYEIVNPGGEYSHWVYVIQGSVTTNRAERVGKVTSNRVEAAISP